MTKKDIKGVGYEFVEGGHAHYLDGERLTGITTILGVIAKPALISWAANMAVDYIDEKLPVKRDNNVLSVDADDFKRILEEARKAHTRKKEEAGQKGTDVHAEVELLIKEAIDASRGIVGAYSGTSEQVGHFINWAKDNKVKFLESEAKIYSKSLFLGGICDFVCEIDKEIWIGDIKTGSGIYAEAFYQTAGYQMLFEEMGLYSNIKGHLILNLKKTGEFKEKRSISNDDNKQAFLSALSLYRITAKTNGTL
uniref:PD-(D/E)XK nuclease superfamily protein n=1 Tax=viral metagenome TaxID=1070528 RepID=A0A6M3L9L5_9ZZZZ